MWGFLDCTHYLHRHGQTNVVLKDASLIAEDDDAIAIFAPPGRGKTTIVRLVMGMDRPVEGVVLCPAGAWPLGYAGGFRAEMTGEENVRVMAHLSGIDPDELSAFVYSFSELDDAYFLPVAYYTNRMKGRLGFATSLGIPSRVIVADDKLVPSDGAFREKCESELRRQLETAGLIFLTSNPRGAEDICDRFFVLNNSQFEEFDTYAQANEKLEEIKVRQDIDPDEAENSIVEQEQTNNAMLYFDLV